MAQRPVFYVSTRIPYYREEMVTFQFSPGFAVVQKQKNIQEIHRAFIAKHRNARPLEISSKSETLLGVQLSAFNLHISINGTDTTVESAFQSSKVFRDGGPYTDLLYRLPYEAKKDPRLQESGPLTGFDFDGQVFPLWPRTFFYDWLYINAVHTNKDLMEKLCQYNCFTDIEFNPQKSINCQARSAAIYVSLNAANMIDEAVSSPREFKRIVYGEDSTPPEQQLSLFE